MMKLRQIFLAVVLMTALFNGLPGQVWAQANRLQAFAPLVGGRWQAAGEWSTGMKFEQEIAFTWALNQTIVLAESYGVINPKTGERGHRNHGVRAWNTAENKLWFWEFDVFGGLTQGEVEIDGKGISMIYEYGDGDKRVRLRDRWQRVDDQTYDFTVEQFENGQWGRVLLATQFRRIAAGN
ncbi:MAG: hypothetical protein ACE5IR_10240 [bacterium]